MSEIKKIGLKYCGGCKAEYDRVASVAAITERLAGKIEFVAPNNRQLYGTLIVAGCATACVNTKPFAGRPFWIITSPREADLFVQLMQNPQGGHPETNRPSPSGSRPLDER